MLSPRAPEVAEDHGERGYANSQKSLEKCEVFMPKGIQHSQPAAKVRVSMDHKAHVPLFDLHRCGPPLSDNTAPLPCRLTVVVK